MNDIPTNDDFAFSISRKQSAVSDSQGPGVPESSPMLQPPNIDFDNI